jgi:hypothetical protein
MFRFDYFFARWNLSYPPNQSSIQAGPEGASKRSLITKTRCETLHPWAAYALISVSASRIEFWTLERALPYGPTEVLAHLPSGDEHRPDNQRDVGT